MMRMSLMQLAQHQQTIHDDDDEELEFEMEVTTLDTNLMITIYDDDDYYYYYYYDDYDVMNLKWHCLRLNYRCLY